MIVILGKLIKETDCFNILTKISNQIVCHMYLTKLLFVQMFHEVLRIKYKNFICLTFCIFFQFYFSFGIYTYQKKNRNAVVNI